MSQLLSASAPRRSLSALTASLLIGLAPLAWGQTLWLDDAGRPGAAAQQAVQWLTQADRDGLRPADYGASTLSQALTQAQTSPPAPDAAARLDAELTDAVLRYLNQLRLQDADARLRTTAALLWLRKQPGTIDAAALAGLPGGMASPARPFQFDAAAATLGTPLYAKPRDGEPAGGVWRIPLPASRLQPTAASP